MEVLFKTLRGSRLHGLSTEESDWDYYTVIDKPRPKIAKYSTHKIVDDTDSVVVDLGTWLRHATQGTPDALEAMFSRSPELDRLTPLRVGFKYTGSLEPYLRLIKATANSEVPKHRRHALRFALNASDLARYGRFNPTLSDYHKEFVLGNINAYDVEQLAMYVFHNGWDLPLRGRRNVISKA